MKSPKEKKKKTSKNKGYNTDTKKAVWSIDLKKVNRKKGFCSKNNQNILKQSFRVTEDDKKNKTGLCKTDILMKRHEKFERDLKRRSEVGIPILPKKECDEEKNKEEHAKNKKNKGRKRRKSRKKDQEVAQRK